MSLGMIRAYFTIAVVTLCFTFTSEVRSEPQYWVSVASNPNEEAAQRAASRASADLFDVLSVIGVATEKGYTYRVATGPFTSFDLALGSRDIARSAGFSDAWIWVDSESSINLTSSLEPIADYQSDGSTNQFDSEYLDADFDVDLDAALDSSLDADWESVPDLPDYESETRDAEPGDYPQGLDTPQEMNDVAPPGYELNKLRRDSSTQGPNREQLFVRLHLGDVPTREGRLFRDMQNTAGFEGLEEVEELEEIVREEVPEQVPEQVLLELELGDPVPLGKFSEDQLAVKIDGKLNEPEWQAVLGVDSFVVTDPDTLDTPRYQTVVKIFYSDRGMYVGFEMQQPVHTLVQRFSGRDDGGINRDAVSITLDTSGSGRYGYWMSLALGGNQTDGTVLPERQFSSDWDGAWEGATNITAKGWDAEIFLPWSQVAMPSEAGRRTINAYVSRKVAALDERWTIPALPSTQPLFMSALQPLTLEQVNPRGQWSFFPYGSITEDAVDDTTEYKVGADIFYRPSSDFQITAALNPDFGNVESDDVIVNLSAFETFFPEKRLFFKEGIEIFDTSPRGSTRVLHTRRIGSSPQPPDVPSGIIIPGDQLGQPTELQGAVKAVGTVGSVRYGILTAVEDETKFDAGALNFHQEGTDYGVARFLYEGNTETGAYRALGAISTLSTHPREDAFVQGVDYHYLTSRGALKVDGQMLYSDTDDAGTGSGGFVDVAYQPNSAMRYQLAASHYDDQLDINDLGFLRRNGVSAIDVNAEYRVSSPGWARWARKLRWRNSASLEVNSNGDKTNQGIGTRLGLDFDNRTDVRLSVNYNPERVDDRSSRGNGDFVRAASHSTSFDFRSDSSKSIYYELGVGHAGEDAGGHRVRGQLGITWRPVDHFNVGAFAQYQVRDGWVLWQGEQNFTSFESREWRPNLNLNYFLSAKQQLRFSAQWIGIKAEEDNFYTIPADNGNLTEIEKPPGASDDFAISNLAVQLRYRWEMAPLSELFVVYTLNGNQFAIDDSFTDLLTGAYQDPNNEQLVVKLRYRLGS